MAYDGLTVEYVVKTTGDQLFIPGNVQSPVNSHDNPDNGTKAQRLAGNILTSPDAVEKVAT
jgi:hypothetical protein